MENSGQHDRKEKLKQVAKTVAKVGVNVGRKSVRAAVDAYNRPKIEAEAAAQEAARQKSELEERIATRNARHLEQLQAKRKEEIPKGTSFWAIRTTWANDFLREDSALSETLKQQTNAFVEQQTEDMEARDVKTVGILSSSEDKAIGTASLLSTAFSDRGITVVNLGSDDTLRLQEPKPRERFDLGDTVRRANEERSEPLDLIIAISHREIPSSILPEAKANMFPEQFGGAAISHEPDGQIVTREITGLPLEDFSSS